MKAAAPLLMAGVLLLSGCATSVGYLAKQGRYLLRDTVGARSVQSLINDPSTSSDTRDFLLLTREIKRFAVETVGLKDNGNYTRYREIDGDHLVDVVSGCDAVSFTGYLWSYPLLGKLPYKGFYELADAEQEASRLKKDGYDVVLRPVDAFSTLGFTKDPLYSFMKKYTPFQIASLIIHEQTHATLFVKGQSQFNEELATFVGDEGAFEWLRLKYGQDSTEYRNAIDEDADLATFIALLKGLSVELDAVYKSTLSREEKLDRKAQIIGAFKQRLGGELASRFHSASYKDLGKLPINNAYLSLYSLYSDDIPLLRSYWEKKCGSDLKRFMEAAKKLAQTGDVKALMRKELEDG
ncbi:MAG: aminopeptidase [Spirochaetia bacterium]